KPQKYRNDKQSSNQIYNNHNNNLNSANAKATTTTLQTTDQYQRDQANYLSSNQCSSQVINSLDIISVELQQQQQQQQHYNNNYYYYYNYNLSYAPPAPHECLLVGTKGRLQQLKRRTQHELQQWPLLMQLVVLILWLHGKFWQLVREHFMMPRRRWH
ncbi:vacuolar protein-sorting-associated protein 36, partial [Drosophila busckii]|uniref:vacuolar protein-sorting-associated protein 36 n=1 Tax=Drosophila busckii TaxID=30019 RepID=UPI001432DB9E